MSAAQLTALLPLIILGVGATLLLLWGAWAPRSQGPTLGGALLAFAAALASGLITPPVVAIQGLLAFDPLARTATLVFSLLAGATLLIGHRYTAERAFASGLYSGLLLFAAAGMALLGGATSLTGLFVGLESLSLALYILIGFDRQRPESSEAAIKYLILGMTASGVLAFGIGLIYLGGGSLDLRAAASVLASDANPLALCGWALLLVAAGFKLSFVPFHLWTADVYQGAPTPVSGLLAAGSKGAVALLLIRLVTLLPDGGWGKLAPLLSVLAILTLLAGPFAALGQSQAKRLFGWSSVGQLGFVLAGVSVGSREGAIAAGFFIVAYALATFCAFALLTTLAPAGEELDNIAALRGLGWRRPWLGGALALCLFSLAGIPGTAGFLGKLQIFLALLRAGAIPLALTGALAVLLAAAFYLRLLLTLYEPGTDAPLARTDRLAACVIFPCVILILLFGLYPTPLLYLLSMVVP